MRMSCLKTTNLDNTVGEVLSKHGLNTITNCGNRKISTCYIFHEWWKGRDIPGEERILIDSPKVATYDLKPEMSAYEVTDALVNAIRRR